MLLIVERKFRLRPGNLFALYVFLYSIGRLWIETLRIDPSHEIAGLRLNVWVAAIAIIASGAFFVWWQRTWKRGQGATPPKPETMAIPKERVRPQRSTPGTPSGRCGVSAAVDEGGAMRHFIALLVLVAALVAAGTASAGGFATVGLGSLPTGVSAGEPWDPEITILQHGRTPLEGLMPMLTIYDERRRLARLHGDGDRRAGRLPGARRLPGERELERRCRHRLVG